MGDKRKIKEIYNCVAIVSNEELYPLQKWYNQLIEKTIDEITIADVLKMIRQKEFTNLAMSKAIYFCKRMYLLVNCMKVNFWKNYQKWIAYF